MLSADMHLHSSTSADSREDIETMCRSALAKGMDTVAFTEHHDAYSEEFSLNIAEHEAAINRARAAFAQLTILKGIEVGYAPETALQAAADVEALKPDYVLLSVHAVDGVDPYFGELFFMGRTREEGLRAYLDTILEAIWAMPDWDALAHIGYAARYAPPGVAAKPLVYADAPDKIDAILKKLIQMDRALEVNTSETAKGLPPIPGEDILRRYFALGGRALVVGSDAHAADNVAYGFSPVRDLLGAIGFTHYRVFEGRIMRERKL
jgi:histidinol-phosphatase (PHP family)